MKKADIVAKCAKLLKGLEDLELAERVDAIKLAATVS